MAACDEADAIALASFRRAIAVSAKPDATYVTAADTAVEAAVRERIGHRFPDHGLVGEEYGEQPAASGRRWIIDPIDGTHNYMRGLPIFATLLALEVEGELALGVVSAPALARRWFAWRDGSMVNVAFGHAFNNMTAFILSRAFEQPESFDRSPWGAVFGLALVTACVVLTLRFVRPPQEPAPVQSPALPPPEEVRSAP